MVKAALSFSSLKEGCLCISYLGVSGEPSCPLVSPLYDSESLTFKQFMVVPLYQTGYFISECYRAETRL